MTDLAHKLVGSPSPGGAEQGGRRGEIVNVRYAIQIGHVLHLDVLFDLKIQGIENKDISGSIAAFTAGGIRQA